MHEGTYKTLLTKNIYQRFGKDHCLVVRFDSALMQGLSDMGILFDGGFWAVLEAKISLTAKRQPNQPYYVKLLDRMCFAAFICPENEEAVLDELQQELENHWAARIS